ncbi:hypothetical protein [Cohnella nanjingensis]|uniref:Uncharacterized protein n=1 Tax=Cohnella nanjingensis TaxID=1387779 RepID=A0A7X0RPY9_9BACL|nr:hypothetical protein [Cohnella nanjingensis]MBB6671391.1 hypothetical protein [Cohnella nanjingensis]
MASKRKTNPNRFVTAELLRRMATVMLPFYGAVAARDGFARQWSRALLALDLDRMLKLLRAVSRGARKEPLGIGTNAIGYFVSFSAAEPIGQYADGVTIPPGTVQYTFETRIHRAVAKAVIPLYRSLAGNPRFAASLARAIRGNDRPAAIRLVRSRIRTAALKEIAIESSGVALTFKFKSTKYEYRNLFFQDIPGA